jgi:hypothetical protein
MTTTRRDAATAGPIPGSPMPRPGCGEFSQGTFLRIADVRSQPTNISVAASRSTPSRRVVPSRKLPDRRHHSTSRPPPTTPITHAQCDLPAARKTMPSTRQTVALTGRSISVLQP